MSRAIPRLAIASVLGALLVGLPVLQLTDTSAEKSVKQRLGLIDEGCVPQVRASAGWAKGPALPDRRDEPRAVEVGGQVYLAGGIAEILDYGDPGTVEGVKERVEVRSLRALTRFDPRSGEYTELAPLPRPLNHIGMVAHGGDIYVVGGHGNLLVGAEVNRDLYRYSIAQDAWTKLAPMPTARGAVSVGVLGDRLVVAGGMVAGRPISTVEAYDFGTGKWERLPDMRRPREHAPGAVVDGRFYVAGGRDATTDAMESVEVYDPEKRKWSFVDDLPKNAGGGEALAFRDTLLVIGGGDDRRRTVTGAVQRYDPASGTWTRLADMRTPRHGFGGVVVGDRIWTFGGSPCALFNASDIVDVFEPAAALRASGAS